MYNLCHIYLYENIYGNNLDKSIELSIRSMNRGFEGSFILFIISLIKKYKNINLTNIQEETAKYSDLNQMNVKIKEIYRAIIFYQFNNSNNFNLFYQSVKHFDFIYDYDFSFDIAFYFFHNEIYTADNAKPIPNVNSEFYNGFNLPLD